MSDAVAEPTQSDFELLSRLRLMSARLDELQAAEAALAAETERHNQVLTAIQSERKALEADRERLAVQGHKLAQERNGLTSAMNTYQTERDRWEAVRRHVDEDITKREIALKTAEEDLAARKQRLMDTEAALRTSAQAIAQREAAHARRHTALEAALKVT